MLFRSSERGIGNSLAILGDDSVLVVDSTLPGSARKSILALKRKTDQPVRYLVNTHWHDDHIWGNQSYVDAFPGVTIIAHTTTRSDIVERAIPNLHSTIKRLETVMAERQARLHSLEEPPPEMRSRVEKFRTVLAEYQAIRPFDRFFLIPAIESIYAAVSEQP